MRFCPRRTLQGLSTALVFGVWAAAVAAEDAIEGSAAAAPGETRPADQ